MSTEAEGSAPSYRDSVLEMMLELKKNKGSNKSSTNASISSTANNEEKGDQVLVAKIIDDFSTAAAADDDIIKAPPNDNNENTSETSNVETIDNTSEISNVDTNELNSEMSNIDINEHTAEVLKTNSNEKNSKMLKTDTDENNWSVCSETPSSEKVNVEEGAEEKDPLCSLDIQTPFSSKKEEPASENDQKVELVSVSKSEPKKEIVTESEINEPNYVKEELSETETVTTSELNEPVSVTESEVIEETSDPVSVPESDSETVTESEWKEEEIEMVDSESTSNTVFEVITNDNTEDELSEHETSTDPLLTEKDHLLENDMTEPKNQEDPLSSDKDGLKNSADEDSMKSDAIKIPEVVELSDGDDANEGSGSEEDEEDETGNPDRPPGEDAVREIEPDHLLPFHHGWRREVVTRKGNGQIATQYDVSYLPPDNGQYRTREAKRKRISKTDQEKYFVDFPSPVLSIKNFSYVRRPLGMNNAAYEILRKGKPATAERAKPVQKQTPTKTAVAASAALTTSSNKGRRVSSYKEVEESMGLLDENNETDDEVVCINGFDVITDISLQVNHSILGMRSENKKRGKQRDPDTCCTPPLAEDSLWTGLDDDPMGIYNELGGRSSPTTPPPLRAVRLTPNETAKKIRARYAEVRDIAAQRDFLQEQEQQESLASHDFAIRKFKNYKEQRYPAGFVSSYGQQIRRKGDNNGRYSSSLIMKPVLDHMRHLPGISWSTSSAVRNNLRPCSMQCPGTGGTMPDIQCSTCKRLYHAKCQGAAKQNRMFKCRLCRAGGLGTDSRNTKETIRMKLPMQPVNGKRPVVELVMLQNGRYQPIRFSNNVQVTETIPKSMFEQANTLRKTVYQKATQVPRVGSNSIYIAVNPTQRPPQPQQQKSSSTLSTANSNSSSSEQVSILVRPHKGGKPVLLNVPRKIALKVKNGTTLSFSASSDQKYVVISNKIHPPVGPSPRKPAVPTQPNRSSGGSTSFLPLNRARPATVGSNVSITKTSVSVFAGILPASVSLEPIAKGQSSKTLPVNRKRPSVSVSINRAQEPAAKARKTGGNVLSSGEIVASTSTAALTPCTPYCPGVSGFPELECCSCKSLFHLKCVGIPQTAFTKIKNSFKCRLCSVRKTSKPASLVPSGGGKVQVIDLD